MTDEQFEALIAAVRKAAGATLQLEMMRNMRVRITVGVTQLFVFLEPDEDADHWARQIVARVKQSCDFVPIR